MYAPRLLEKNSGVKIQTLKARLGIVPGSGQSVVYDEENE